MLPALIGAASLGAGLFGKRASPQSIDINPLIDTIKAGATRQQGILTSLTPKLQPFGTQLQTGITSAETTADAARRASASNLLQSLNTDEKRQADLAKQRVLETQPELTRQLRENLAATGGLQRGAAAQAFTGLNEDLATKVASSQQDIATQGMQNAAHARDQIFSMDNTAIQNKLGIDKDTLNTIFTSGREDLIREALGLLGVDENMTQGILDLQKFGATQQFGVSAANASNKNAILDALSGFGGNVLGRTLVPTSTPQG